MLVVPVGVILAIKRSRLMSSFMILRSRSGMRL